MPTVAFSQLSSNICCPRDAVSRSPPPLEGGGGEGVGGMGGGGDVSCRCAHRESEYSKAIRVIAFDLYAQRNITKSNRNQIVFTMHRLIWNQTEVRLAPNQSGNGKYNLISFDLMRFLKDFCLHNEACPCLKEREHLPCSLRNVSSTSWYQLQFGLY